MYYIIYFKTNYKKEHTRKFLTIEEVKDFYTRTFKDNIFDDKMFYSFYSYNGNYFNIMKGGVK